MCINEDKKIELFQHRLSQKLSFFKNDANITFCARGHVELILPSFTSAIKCR